jgi:UDP-glucose 4-epimerase
VEKPTDQSHAAADAPAWTQSSSPGRSILVTGGAGFVGSHLVDALLMRSPSDRITVIDDLSTGQRANLDHAFASAPGRIRLIERDLSDAIALLSPSEHFDHIYHLAAAVGVRLIIDQPIRSIETNIVGTCDLLRFASRCGHASAPASVLITSSSEVYGKPDKSPFNEDDDVVYGPTTRSRWSYAASKAIDEYLALAYRQQHGVRSVVVRLFNTTGPRQVGSYGMVLPNFVKAALDGRDLEVFGDGAQTRCFADVRDVAAALPTLLEAPACAGKVFNVGSDRSISIKALAELVIATLGSSSGVQLVPYERAYGPGFEDLRKREPDLARVRSAIGFAPRIALEQTIRDIADNLRSRGTLATRSPAATQATGAA